MTKPWEETFEAFTGDDSQRFIGARGVTIAEVLDDDHERLLVAAPDMARVLLAVEWEPLGTCPSCRRLGVDIPDNPITGAVRATGHRPDCALDAALRKAGVR